MDDGEDQPHPHPLLRAGRRTGYRYGWSTTTSPPAVSGRTQPTATAAFQLQMGWSHDRNVAGQSTRDSAGSASRTGLTDFG
jgi:hypothetical protein